LPEGVVESAREGMSQPLKNREVESSGTTLFTASATDDGPIR
jgi:hypothetical protein